METFDEAAPRRLLSALADGEVDGGDGLAACRAWADDASARRDWHAWHLAGDVLRSEDLASDPRADLRFCAAVSARLALEPVVLAPAPLVAARAAGPASAAPRRSGRWMFGSAVAAGFVLVAGTFALVRSEDPVAPGQVGLVDGARAPLVAAGPATRPVRSGEGIAPSVAMVADSRSMRDAQLDRYLVAHKQFAGISALGVPSVFLRSATVDSTAR